MVISTAYNSVLMRPRPIPWVHSTMLYHKCSILYACPVGSDGKFIQWSLHKTGKKIAEYSIHSDAHQPLYQWTETGSHATHTREVTKASLFALEAEGHHILTAGAKQAIIYQVSQWIISLTCLLITTATFNN